MDWEKAKNALIAIFFILNIFLLALVVQAQEDVGMSNEVERKVRGILAQKNIDILCAIPSETATNKMLTYGNDGFDMKKVNGALGGSAFLDEYGILLWEGLLPFGKEGPVDRELFCLGVIKDMGLSWANFYLDEKNADETELLFIGKYRNYLVFENYIRFTLTGEGITHIESAAKKIGNVSNSSQKIVNINAILMSLSDAVSDADVVAIEPGFINFAPSIDSTMRINDPLVWRVTLSTGEVKIFRALDGALIE